MKCFYLISMSFILPCVKSFVLQGLMVSVSKSDRKELTRDLDAHARRMKSLVRFRLDYFMATYFSL